MYIYRGTFNLFNYAENEAMTVVVPTSFLPGESVYTFWRWTTTPPGCSDAQFSDVGTIRTDNVDSKSSTEIVFSHNNYHFDVILGPKSLVLILTLRDGTTQPPMPLYQAYGHPTAKESPCIFVGKINSRQNQLDISAVDEMFIIIAPKGIADQQPLCAFWQRSEPSKHEITKEGVDCVSQVQSIARASSIAFAYGGDYLFEGELSEGGTQLSMTMKHEELGFADIVAQLLQPSPIVSDILIFDTSVVENDTEEVVYCTLREEKDGIVDAVLSVSGLILGILGFPGVTTAFSKIVNNFDKIEKLYGKVVGGLGGVAGAGGIMQFGLGYTGTESKPGPLAPGEKKRRTASGQPGTKNNVQIIRGYLKKQGDDRWICIDSIERVLNAGDTLLSSLIKPVGADIPITVTTTLLEFSLPQPASGKTAELTTKSLTTFSHLVPFRFGTDPLPSPSDLAHISREGVYTSTRTATPHTTLVWISYGTLADRIATAKANSLKVPVILDQTKFLEYHDTDETHIALPSSNASPAPTEYSILSFVGGGMAVLKFTNATIYRNTGGSEPGTITGSNTTDEKVLALINNNKKENTPYYWAYWRKNNNALFRYDGETNAGLRYASGQEIYIVATAGAKVFRRLREVDISP